MPTTCVEDLLGRATPGTLMKCSSRSTDAFITYGVRLIRMAMFWIFSSKATEIRSRQEVLPQTVKGIALCPESDRDGQVEELWCGEGCGASQCRTPARE